MNRNPRANPKFTKPRKDIPLHHIKVPPHIHELCHFMVAEMRQYTKTKYSVQEFVTAQVASLIDSDDGLDFQGRILKLEPYIRSWAGEWKRVYLEKSVLEEFSTAIQSVREQSGVRGATREGLYPSNVFSALIMSKYGNAKNSKKPNNSKKPKNSTDEQPDLIEQEKIATATLES